MSNDAPVPYVAKKIDESFEEQRPSELYAGLDAQTPGSQGKVSRALDMPLQRPVKKAANNEVQKVGDQPNKVEATITEPKAAAAKPEREDLQLLECFRCFGKGHRTMKNHEIQQCP